MAEDLGSKSAAPPEWRRRWFELKDGVIRHAASDQVKDLPDSTYIPIENIIRLVTANKSTMRRRPSLKLSAALLAGGQEEEASVAQHLITMKTTHEKLILRAESVDDLNRYVRMYAIDLTPPSACICCAI